MPEVRPPAATRGDIQAGRTGDKTPGFDPAAAPMETDAEASGVSTPAAAELPARGRPEHTNATSHASAMRPLGNRAERAEPRNRRREVWALLCALGLAALLLAAYLLIDDGRPTAPVDRVDEQNSGTNAPQETVPPADGGSPSQQGG
jgi:hypothetical protein